jgi:hypothetical protein
MHTAALFAAAETLSPRALHARLLDNAAARRKRGQERRRAHRDADAGYWFSVAPLAVRKAGELRCDAAFAALP